jgi:hypothetical protein
MTCPDENVFMQVQAGSLSDAETAAFHVHLDNCPACLELASLLGCLHDGDVEFELRTPSKIAASESTPGERLVQSILPRAEQVYLGGRQLMLITHGVMLLLHAYSSITMLPNLWLAFRADVTPINGPFGTWIVHSLWVPYLLIWGCLGPLFACSIAFGLLKSRRWVYVAMRSYSLACLPSLILAPIAICLLFAARFRRIGS